MDIASILLALLTLHRTGSSIALHEAKSQIQFSTALAILLSEMVKLIISLIMAAYTTLYKEGDSHTYRSLPRISSPELEKDASLPALSLQRKGCHAFWFKMFDQKALLLLFPAVIYVCQNNLFLYAAGKLQPSLFQAIWQLRLIPTAYFSQLFLKKKIGGYRWLSLSGLVVGVVVIQSSFATPVVTLESHLLFLTPIFALLLSALLAALAGVTLEGIFTQEETDIWIVNVHLSTFSMLPCIVLVVIEASDSPEGFSDILNSFKSSYWPWVAVLINGKSGVLVALVTKYAGCIANNISGIASIATTHMFELTFPTKNTTSTSPTQQVEFYLGMAVVVISSYYYMTLAIPVKNVENDEVGTPLISISRISSSSGLHSDQYSNEMPLYEIKGKSLEVSLYNSSA